MDNAQRRTAIVQETTWATTPSSPGFKVLRETSADGVADSNDVRSNERSPHRMAAAMVHGNTIHRISTEIQWHRDAGLDLMWENLLNAAWATNVIKNGVTQKPYTMEITHAGGGTLPYRRFPGVILNTAQISWRVGQAGQLSFSGFGKGHTTATSAIASSTYASPTPGYDPVAPSAITVTNMFGLTAPVLTSLEMTISNDIEPEYGFGSDTLQFAPLGKFDVMGRVTGYFKQLADYSTFVTRQSGLAMDITIGSVANFKDKFELMNCDVWNPAIPDKASRGSDEFVLNFMAKYHAADTAAIKITRLVA